MTKFLLFIFVLLFPALKSYSRVFTVSSNADSGTGTLREALQLASENGIAEADFIYFNLALSEAGRTITLLSPLPAVSSNLTIDASSQPGAVFGVSTARVQLISNYNAESNSNYVLLLSEVKDVAIYALYIRNIRNILPDPAGYYHYFQGISIKNSKGIRIGAAGKGNVICGFQANVGVNIQEGGGQIGQYSEDFYFKANFIGLEADGLTLSTVGAGGLEMNHAYGEVVVGGTPEEGNLMPTLSIYQVNYSDSPDPRDIISSLPARIVISNNKIGVDFTASNKLANAAGVWIVTVIPGGKNTVEIADNVIYGRTNGIYIGNNERVVNIRSNYIGTNRTLTKNFSPPVSTGIVMYYATQVNIGSNDPTDANYIAFCKPVMVLPFSNASVNKNSFFCTVDAFPMLDIGNSRIYPTIEITETKKESIRGTATPNSVVELFYSDECGTCSPQTYFASIKTNAAGYWQYNGNLKGVVIASATLNGATSEFTRPRIDDHLVTIVPTCSNTGSVKGVVPLSAHSFKWLNEAGEVIGTDPDLINVPPGKYTLQIFNGDCTAEKTFEVQQPFALNTDDLIKGNEICGNGNGYIKGITVINNTDSEIVYSWKDADGNNVGGTADLSNVKTGSYTLTVSMGDKGCAQTYGPVVLLDVNGAPINYGQPIISYQNASCGLNNGTLNISFTQGNPKSYRWIDKNTGQAIGNNSAVLSNLDVGTYQLFVADDYQCEQFLGEYTVNRDAELELDATDVRSLPDYCGQATGSISGIQVSGTQPLSFKWTNESGRVISDRLDVNTLVAGDYVLTVTDGNGCEKSLSYTVSGTTGYIVPPQVNDLEVCSAGTYVLMVNQVSRDNVYRIYSNRTSVIPLDEQRSGRFTIKVKNDQILYVSQLMGDCESERVAVKIKVGYTSIQVPNSFTPNGDGINDQWIISDIESYPNVHVQLFNRYGKKVFESLHYRNEFNGEVKGIPLPLGAYYYIIKMGDACNPLSGNLTILR